MKTHNPKVCIVGAGPAGLAAARHLSLRNIDYDHYEKHTGVGGIWDIENSGTPMYESAHFISSRTLSGYYDYPMPDHYPDYPSRELVLEYTKSFADAYKLTPQIQFSKQVKSIVPDGKNWSVELADGITKSYTHVICASGHTWTPNWPEYPGNFNGDIMHAVDFKKPDIFSGKRVLVVGAGNSACDIACEAARSAKAAFISMRRGYHFVPKHILGQPADVFSEKTKWLPFKLRRWLFACLLKNLNGDLTKQGLQIPDHKILESHPIINSQLVHYLQHGDISACHDIADLNEKEITFTDGRKEEIDLIVFATGYKYAIPYIDKSHFDWNGNKPSLAYTVFNRRHETLFAAGFTEMNAGGYYIFDEMTSLIADAIELQSTSIKRWKKAQRVILKPQDFSGGIGFINSERHNDYLDMDTYLKACKKLCRKLGWQPAKERLTKA
ncbi:MAG: NAD(P)-binding domain-containing protein [Aquisalinus sp.]|nr:NAD(P)-binding domain-containing protein [Aquisalinus sp.]